MASIREREQSDGSKSWQVQIRIKGMPAITKTVTTSREDAEAWGKMTEGQLQLGLLVPQKAQENRRTVGELIDAYVNELPRLPRSRDWEKRAIVLRWWKAQLGKQLLSAVSPTLVRTKRSELESGRSLSGKLPSPATVNRYMTILSACWTWGLRNEWCVSNPVRALEKRHEDNERDRILDPDTELPRLLDACEKVHPYMKPLVLLAITTGLRRSNILWLRWSDITLTDKSGKVFVKRTKNGTAKTAPLSGDVLLELRKIHDITGGEPHGLVFPGEKKTSPFALDSPWGKVLAVAGIRDFHFHDLRHTGASYIAMTGGTMRDIQDYLGNKTIRMAIRYTHLMPQHCEGVVNRMTTRFLGTTGQSGHPSRVAEHPPA